MASRIRGDLALRGLEETTLVPDAELKAFLRTARSAGGRLRRSAPCTIEGEPGYAVTMVFL